ncbi:vWA domain-containing protein [Mesorhizobium xinjiangense]|uniref:hypothetical protein n=1 Tax=Mesorhizobium xinjiangense TaxID=2678685 RepID=UPI0012ED74F2|nr:hypothetical protein [Mesorhizobium xinjiangense]
MWTGLSQCKQRLRQFARREDGAFAPAAGAAVVLMALAAGFAINTAQITNTRSNLLAALDSAVTSTARDLTTRAIEQEEAEEMVRAFLMANGVLGFSEQDRLTLDYVRIDPIRRTVAAGASVDIDYAFPLFSMSKSQKVSVSTEAIYSDKAVEVAMVLDVTGSMEGQRMRDLKVAAKNAVRSFLKGQNADDPRVRVSIVPYAAAVNVGSLYDTVFREKYGKYQPDLPPQKDEPLEPAMGPHDDDCTTERKNKDREVDISDAAPTTIRQNNDDEDYFAWVNRDDRLDRGDCPSAVVVPLTADVEKLVGEINDFEAKGTTAGQIGIQWGWYMLSEKWASELPTGSKPAAHDPEKVGKFLVLMTDGEFNTAYAGVDYTTTDRWGRTRTVNVNGQETKSGDYAERFCAAMKDDGIEIFSIGFQLDKWSAKQVMRNCASPDEGSIQHYFEASTGDDLDDAFQTIVGNIERLSLIK